MAMATNCESLHICSKCCTMWTKQAFAQCRATNCLSSSYSRLGHQQQPIVIKWVNLKVLNVFVMCYVSIYNANQTGCIVVIGLNNNLAHLCGRTQCRSGARKRRMVLCLASHCAGSLLCQAQTHQNNPQPSISPSTTPWSCAGWRWPPWSALSPICSTLNARSRTSPESSCPPTGLSPRRTPWSNCCSRGEELSPTERHVPTEGIYVDSLGYCLCFTHECIYRSTCESTL